MAAAADTAAEQESLVIVGNAEEAAPATAAATHSAKSSSSSAKDSSSSSSGKDKAATTTTTTTTTTAAGGAGATRKVIFLNCHLFGYSFVGRLWCPLVHREDSRAAAITDHIVQAAPDYVVLAEVWGQKLARRIADDPRVKAMLPHSWLDPRSGGPRVSLKRVMGSGMVLLSRDPISQQSCTEYRMLSGWDSWARKCIFTALCGDVLLGGTHVEAEGDPPGRACRADNIDQLVEHVSVAARMANTDRVVIAGDFNTPECGHDDPTRTCSDYDALATRMAAVTPPLRDALRRVTPSIAADPSVTSDHKNNVLAQRWGGCVSDVRNRLDYFFVSDSIGVASVPVLSGWKDPGTNNDVSDHYGICLHFQ